MAVACRLAQCQPLLLLLLSLLSLLTASSAASQTKETTQQEPTAAAATAEEEAEEEKQREQLTEEQLAAAKRRVSELFDARLDADGDGYATRTELLRRMSADADASILADVERTWASLNKTTEAEGNATRLSWDTWAAGRVPRRMQKAAADAVAADAVRRAVDVAKAESGIEKLGLKVAMPEAPATPQRPKADDEDGTALAEELRRDQRRWEAADADKDGQLSYEEFKDFLFPDDAVGMRAALAQEAMERMDSDGDGKVSMKEFLVDPDAGEGDKANKAGNKDQGEGAVENKGERVCDKEGKCSGGAGGEGGGAEKYTEANNRGESGAAGREEDSEKAKGREEFAANDKDGDGYLDADELQTALYNDEGDGDAGKEELYGEDADDVIRQVDKDGDGVVSKQEALDGVEALAGSLVTNYGDAIGIHGAPQAPAE